MLSYAMATQPKTSPRGVGQTLDGSPHFQTEPYKWDRSKYDIPFEREQSGGLSDDPSESGEPVKNRKSFKNLTGGR